MKLIFRVYNFWILSLSIILWVILTYLPNGFIEDFLDLEKVIKSGLFGRLSVGFISVFSFLVSVLILSYGFLREKFRRLALREFLQNSYSQFLISFFISAFIINIFSAIYLDGRPVDHNSLNIAYFSLFVSVSYFFCFLPIAFLVIAHADSQDLIGKYVKQLSLQYFPESRTMDVIATIDESNPLTILVQLSRSYFDRDDLHSVNLIIFTTQDQIATLIGGSKDPIEIGRYLSGQRLIWDAIAQKSFQKKEFSAIQNIFLALSNYHLHFSKNKIPLLYLEELRFFIHSLAERLAVENLNETVNDAVVIYEKILEYHYDNSTPPESELKELLHFFEQSQDSYNAAYKRNHWRDRSDLESQWRQIDSDIPYFFNVILYKAIEKKNLILFDRIISVISHLIHVVFNSKMGDKQKAWIIRMLAGELWYFQILGFKKELKIERIITHDSFVIDRMIDNNSLSKEFVFTSASEFLFELYEIDRVDYEVINFWGSIGRHCAGHYVENSTHSETLNYILRVIEKFKELLEEDLKGKNIQLYIWIKEAIESFILYHNDPSYRNVVSKAVNFEINNALIDRCENLVKSFKTVETPSGEVTVHWSIDGPRDMFRPTNKVTK